MNEKAFIKTKDIETKDKLLDLGFQLISENSGLYTFLNCTGYNFAQNKIDSKKISYSNILSF